MSAATKAHRAAELRWRFVAISGADGKYWLVGLQNRTEARRFAKWIVTTGAARIADLRDEHGNDAGEGCAA